MSKVNLVVLKEMRANRVPMKQIGALFGVTKQCIHQLCIKYSIEKPKLEKETPMEIRAKKIRTKLDNGFTLDPETSCWNWTGCKATKTGYGRMSYKGQATTVHRVSYEVFKGPIVDGLFVLHSCDNRLCYNPEHLRLGTQMENVRDREQRGRGKKKTGSLPVKK